jgi:fucose permease
MNKQTVFIAFLAFVLFGTYEGFLGVVWPFMSAELGVPLEALGVLLFVGLGGFVLVSFSSGALIRRRSIHWLLSSSLAFRAAGFLAIAVSPTWLGAIAGAFVIGIGGGGLDPSLNGYVSKYGSARQLNWLHACFGVGATVAPLIATGLYALGASWRWNFVLVGLLFGLCALLVKFTAASWKGLQTNEQSSETTEAPIKSSLRLPLVWLGILFFFLYTGTELSAGQWTFTLFTLGRGFSPIEAGFWVSVYWGSFTAGRILFGFIADRAATHSVVRGALLAAITGAALLWWAPAPWVGFAGLALMGLAQAPVFPVLIASTAARVGAPHAANTIGFQLAAAGLGGAGLTGLIGVLATSINFEAIGASILLLSAFTFIVYELLSSASRRAVER